MELTDSLATLISAVPVVGVLIWVILYFKKKVTELEVDKKDLTDDYKKLAENSIKLIALVEMRLKEGSSDLKLIEQIHELVKQLVNNSKR